MGHFFETISSNTKKFITEQEVFWTATAPLSSEGHVNVSPKGTKLVIKGENDDTSTELQVFWVINENQVGYFDFYGSGVETLSHLREPNNGRITLQFNSFESFPRIIRLFGHGRAYDVDSPEFLEHLPSNLKDSIEKLDLVRSLIIVDVTLVGQSCGYGVPIMGFNKHRTNFIGSLEKKKKSNTEDSLINMHRKVCGKSVDGMSPYPSPGQAKVPFLTHPLSDNQNLYLAAVSFALGVIFCRLFSLAL